MGRNKIEMKKIVGKPSRSVTFTKRRQGLFKKAAQQCVMCDAQIAIIVFSDAKKPKPYTFGHSSVDTVLQHYANGTAPLRVPNLPYLNSLLSSMSKLDKELENEKQGAFWWEKIQVEEIECLDELESMKTKLEKLRESLVRKLEKMELERLSASLLGDNGLVNNDFTLPDENGSDLLLKEDDNLPMILDSFAATNSSEAPGNVDSLEDISSWFNTDNSVNGFYGGVDSV